MNKKYYAVYPGQIKIDNEVFFGIDYKITDFINELMEQVKKQKEVIDKAIEYLEAKRIREKAIVDIDVLEGILKEVE